MILTNSKTAWVILINFGKYTDRTYPVNFLSQNFGE